MEVRHRCSHCVRFFLVKLDLGAHLISDNPQFKATHLSKSRIIFVSVSEGLSTKERKEKVTNYNAVYHRLDLYNKIYMQIFKVKLISTSFVLVTFICSSYPYNARQSGPNYLIWHLRSRLSILDLKTYSKWLLVD